MLVPESTAKTPLNGDEVPMPTDPTGLKPVAANDNIESDEVANVDGDDVAMYKLPFTDRKVNGLDVFDPSVNASCGRVDDDTVSAHFGVVVPIPMVSAEFGVIARLSAVVVAHLSVDAPDATAEVERHVPPIAKHPPVRLIPTFEVEVAEPEMVRPLRVVVPKPSPATVRKLVANDDDATWKTGLT